jgi:lipopolysaccharide export system permease protein
MLTIVNRYILKEILLPFALSLLVFTFTLISGNLLKLSNLIINNGIGILVVIKIFLYFIPYLLAYTLPMAFLSAITITFGKFSQDNEITALRASGISVFTIINPILILALGLSFFSIFINNPLMARSHYKMRVALMEMGYKTPEALIKPGRFINTFNRYNFYIKEIDNKILKQVIIYENMDKNRVRTITAQEGYIELSENKNRLILHPT